MVGCSTGAWSPSEVIKPTSSFRQRGMLVALPPSILYFWDGEPVLGFFFWDGEGCRLLWLVRTRRCCCRLQPQVHPGTNPALPGSA